jgi:hypothetical protein
MSESADDFKARLAEFQKQQSALARLPAVLQSFSDGISGEELQEAIDTMNELGPLLQGKFKGLIDAVNLLARRINAVDT